MKLRRLGLWLVTLSLVLGLRAADTAPATPSAPTAKIRVACVGDSITFGYLLRQRATEAYPAVLGRLLGDRYDVGNFGVNSATLLQAGDRPYWKQAAFKQADDFQPATVVLLLGANDTKPVNWAHRDALAADAAALIDHFTALPAKPAVWVCLPVPIFPNKFGIDETNMAEIRRLWREVAAAHGAKLIDGQAPFAAHPELFADGVHPTAAGAALLAQTVAAALRPAPAAPVRVACVGDSITYGYLLPDREHTSYPAVLARLLGPGYTVGNFGVSGATLLKQGGRPYWREAAFQAATDFAPQIVILKLGTNDAAPGNWLIHGSEFAADATALIAHFQVLPSKPAVWVCLPVPIFGAGDQASLFMSHLARIRDTLQAVAKAAGVPVIDAYTPFVGHGEMFADGVHPDAAGAELLAKTVWAAVKP